MSDIRLAVLLEPVGKFKRFALLELEAESKKGKLRHTVHDRTDWQRSEIAEPHQFLEVPPLYDFFTQMQRLSTFSIVFTSTTRNFTVCGFRFGKPARVSVPVFESGKVTSQKFATTTKHINIVAETFDECALKLFRICVSGTLYGFYPKGRLERLYWDTEFQKFETETVSRDSIQVK